MSVLYDNNIFFQNYLDLRKDKENFNDLLEQPKMMELLGNVRGKQILDLGCGYGNTDAKFVDNGAAGVYAIDISEKMIALAKRKNNKKDIEYKVFDIKNLSKLRGIWDIVYSSLVMHYFDDLDNVFKEVYRLLVNEGIFVFSMEHPIVTAGYTGGADIKNLDNITVAYQLDHYNVTGLRQIRWLGVDIEKYHHTVSEIINALSNVGFVIEKMLEPIPNDFLLNNINRMKGEICRPSYLMVRCRKLNIKDC